MFWLNQRLVRLSILLFKYNLVIYLYPDRIPSITFIFAPFKLLWMHIVSDCLIANIYFNDWGVFLKNWRLLFLSIIWSPFNLFSIQASFSLHFKLKMLFIPIKTLINHVIRILLYICFSSLIAISSPFRSYPPFFFFFQILLSP